MLDLQRVRITAIALGLLAGCDEAPSPDGTDEPSATGKADDESLQCDGWSEPLALGKVEDERAVGLSGLRISTRDSSVLWAVNDATQHKHRRLFAFDRHGRELETYPVPDTDGQQWGDLASAGESLILLDVTALPGRARLTVLSEPDPRHEDSIDEVEVVELSAPAGSTMSAIFAVGSEPALYAVAQTFEGNVLLRTPLPLQDGARLKPVLDSADARALDGDIVAADATADGRHVAMKVRDEGVRLWTRGEEETIADALAGDPCSAPGAEGRDRAVAIEPGGFGYLLAPDASDGDRAHLFAIRQEASCPVYDVPRKRGELDADSALEISGVAVSRRHPNVLWAENDGGGGDERVVLVALDRNAEHIGDFALEQADNEDWEDLAIGPADRGGPDVIYIGDIGDNHHARQELRLLRLAEPDVDPNGRGMRSEVISHEEIVLQYPGKHPHNAESLAVDPLSGDVFIITKRDDHDPHTFVFVARSPLVDDEVMELQPVASQDSDGLDARFVAADIDWDGRLLMAQVDGGQTRLWTRHPGEVWASALMWPPCEYDAPDLHIETIAIGPDGEYWMIPEGTDPPVFEATR